VETSPRERERYRDESLRRIATQTNRAPSVLGTFRQQLNSDDERRGDSTERPQRSAIGGLSVRRMFSAKNGRRPKSSSDAATRPLMTESVTTRSPVAIPPPLETLPPESLIQRSPSGKSIRRRKGTITAGATKAFPSFFSSSQPTTAITPTTVVNRETRDFPIQRTLSSANTLTFARSSNDSAVGELQRRFDTDTRMRSSSTSSTLDNERMAAVILPNEVADESSFRNSFDAPTNSGASTVHNRTYSDRKDRRRTVTEVFSRAN